jgi:beta-glucosidase
VTVTNRGRQPGAAVPQLYLRYPDAAGEAPWSLKGFEKLKLDPGERRRLAFTVDERTLRVYDRSTDGWKVVPGVYTLAVGSSSRDLRSRAWLYVGRSSGRSG